MIEVASIAVFNGDKLLMGKRKDSGRWTLPGGHFEDGEYAREAATRELQEETGIEAHQLMMMGSKEVISEIGKQIKVHCFEYYCDKEPTIEFDPDEEVKKWEWIDISQDIPDKIMNNLHAKKNVVLQFLGFQKSGFYIDLQKKEEFVIDLQKARPHKYLRKLRHGDKWIYIYHEGSSHGRVIPEEAVKHVHELAKHGDVQSKSLIDTVKEHHPDKIKALHELAKVGDEPAKKHIERLGLKEHLKEKDTESVIDRSDPYRREMSPHEKSKVSISISTAVKQMFDRFRQHPGSDPEKKLTEAGITEESILEDVGEAPSIAAALEGLDKALKKVDRAHEGVRSSFDVANRAGGYGNMVYNTAVDQFEARGLLPRGVSAKIKRTTENRGNIEVSGPAIQRQAAKIESRRKEEKKARERERQEREVEERRLSAELEGSMASHINSILERPLSARETKQVHETLKNMFGKNMRKEDWPYDFSEHGLDVKISGVTVGTNALSFTFTVKKGGRLVTRSWQRRWSKDNNGNPRIYNALLEVPSNMRGTKIGSIINKNQLKFMRQYAPNGSIAVTANIDVGGYTWANNGFKFASNSERDSYRRSFQSLARTKAGINLTDEDMKKFTLPMHFAIFDDGKTYVHEREGEEDMNVHLGKLFLLGRHWSGVMKMSEMKEGKEAYDHFMNYDQNRGRAWKSARPSFKAVVTEVRGGQRSAPARPAPRLGTTATFPVAGRRWSGGRLPSGYGTWNSNEIGAFISHHGLTRFTANQLRSLRAARRAAGRRDR